MLIDGFTVVAQMINFVILMALLKKFLYQPVLNAIDEREKTISATLSEAKAKMERAEEQQRRFATENQALSEQRAGLVQKAQEEAKMEGRRLLEEARAEAEGLIARRLKSLAEQEEALSHSLFSRAQAEGFEVARQILRDLGDVELEDRLVDVFVQKLTHLEDSVLQTVRDSSGDDRPPVVRSAFELGADQRRKLEQAVSSVLGAERRPRFESAAELMTGLELVTDGYKLSWNTSEALGKLELEAAKQSAASLDDGDSSS